MAEATLPPDDGKPGNVWCEGCQQSLPAGRAAGHLASKKHQQGPAEARAPRAWSARARQPADGDAPPPDGGAQAPGAGPKRGARKAATVGGLTPDPGRAGHYWCGICGASLAPAKAEAHLATARHQENERKALTAAMRAPKASGK